MAMGKRKRQAKQASMWVATQDLPRSAAHPFYARLNQILDQHDFEGFVEGLCERFYADEGRPGLPPGRYFRLLLIGYFEGLDAERAIAWRAADSFALRNILAPSSSAASIGRRNAELGLIRFGGHLPKGGYDVHNGRNEKPTASSAVHG